MDTVSKRESYSLPLRRSVFILGGLGGVGKTTSAAALSLSLALKGARVLVITVDPAKRLTDTFGLNTDGLSTDDPIKISLPASVLAGTADSAGELWVSMLDTKASFDDLIARLCDREGEREAILANAVYKSISSGFAYGSEYIAMERVLYLHEQNKWDYLVVDTPPGENFFTLFSAPKRMAQFFSSKTLRFLVAPYRSKFLNLASKPLYDIVNRLLGIEMLLQVSEFFKLFESVRHKFKKRAEEVEEMLISPITKHVLITTLDSLRSEEILHFIERFLDSRYQLSAVICNSALPEFLLDEENIDFARRLSGTPDQAADALPTEELRGAIASLGLKGDSGYDAEERDTALPGLLKALGENFLNYALLAAGQNAVYEHIASDLGRKLPVGGQKQTAVIKLPYLVDPAGDMEQIAFLGDAVSSALFENSD